VFPRLLGVSLDSWLGREKQYANKFRNFLASLKCASMTATSALHL
jgi:hypothetical protein